MCAYWNSDGSCDTFIFTVSSKLQFPIICTLMTCNKLKSQKPSHNQFWCIIECFEWNISWTKKSEL